MTPTTEHQGHEIHAADQRRRQLRVLHVILAVAVAAATIALFDAGRPETIHAVFASGSVHLADMATDLPAPATAPFGPLYPQTPANLVGGAGFATDDSDDQAQQQAQQQMQQAQQQAEQQQKLAN
jgi:hypothetical protein